MFHNGNSDLSTKRDFPSLEKNSKIKNIIDYNNLVSYWNNFGVKTNLYNDHHIRKSEEKMQCKLNENYFIQHSNVLKYLDSNNSKNVNKWLRWKWSL